MSKVEAIQSRPHVEVESKSERNESSTVRITSADDPVDVQYFTLQEDAVLLEPDECEYFPDLESINHALRALIALIPSSPVRRKAS